jgi:surface antigen/LysM repeat protein
MSHVLRTAESFRLRLQAKSSQAGIGSRLFRKPATRKRLVRYGLLAGNLALLLAVGTFVAKSSDTGSGLQGRPAVASAMATGETLADPLDRLSSTDIAVNVANSVNLEEKTSVANLADSQNAELSVAQASVGLVSKPQIVNTNFKSNKDIKEYMAQSGETAAAIAAKFSVTTDSVLWSNNLASDTVSAGQKLFVLPGVNGIVYVTKPGDTPDSLATKYRASKEAIIQYNDAEIAGLTPGTRIIIPDGKIIREVAAARPRGTSTFAWGGGPIYNGANGYDYGYCTWYVANRIAVPSNWGNANTWDNLAPSSGWVVSTVPKVGAIAQTDRGGFGHVAVVSAVSEDGTQIKYSDMNGLAGWGREGHSDWTSVSRYEHYISR